MPTMIDEPTKSSKSRMRPAGPGTQRGTSTTPAPRRGNGGSRGIRLTRPFRHLALAGAFVVVGGLVGLLPFGTRAAQDETFAASRDRLSQLQQENKTLTAQRDLLQTDEEVARIAREEFGLAPQDATVYAIPDLRPENADRAGTGSSPSVSTTVVAPAPAPKQSFGSRVIDFLVFWD